MSADAKNGYGSTIAFVLLGMLALYGGAQWLLIVIPGGALVWYASTRRGLKKRRN